MGSENEVKRLTFYIWGQWLIIISLLVSMYVIKSDIKNLNKSIESIEKSIVYQQESCNGVSVRIDNVDQKLTEIKKLIEGEW